MHIRALALGSALLIAAALTVGTGGSAPAPAPAATSADPNYLWIPPGTYTAIVVCSSGQQRRWVVSLDSGGQSLPIAVGPHETVVIPFAEGWAVDAADNAKLTARGVIWGIDTSTSALLDEANLRLDAWGITKTGPVKFVAR